MSLSIRNAKVFRTFALIGAIIVVLFDVFASLASVHLRIGYMNFAIPQDAMYIAMGGLFAFISRSWRASAVAVIVAAVAESTVGWYLAVIIGATTFYGSASLTIIAGMLGACLSVVFGIVGISLGISLSKLKKA